MACRCVAYYYALTSCNYSRANVGQVTTARAELVLLSPAQHEMAVRLLQEKEREWVGQAVVARRDDDGVYYPGWLTCSTMEATNNNVNWFQRW